MHKHLLWKEEARALLQRCPIFDLYRSERTGLIAGEGPRSGEFYLLEARDWVTVVPMVRDASGRESFLMVRQFRHGIEQVTLEFPAGLVERGEAPQAAARRELEEETGHAPGRIERLGTVAAAPAFMTNWCHVHVAWDLRPAGSQSLDETEVLDLVTVPVDEADGRMGSGELVNSVTLVSYYFWLRWKGADRIRTGA